MKYQAYATTAYSVLLLIGGVMGYATAGSLPSLIMGTTFAVLLGIAAFGMYKGCNFSRIGATVLLAVLFVFFSYRFLTTYKFFPPGIVALLSLGLLFCLLFCKKTQDEKVL